MRHYWIFMSSSCVMVTIVWLILERLISVLNLSGFRFPFVPFVYIKRNWRHSTVYSIQPYEMPFYLEIITTVTTITTIIISKCFGALSGATNENGNKTDIIIHLITYISDTVLFYRMGSWFIKRNWQENPLDAGFTRLWITHNAMPCSSSSSSNSRIETMARISSERQH